MKVHIENKLFLEADGRQFIIKEYTGNYDEDGSELYKVHGYYSSLKGALNAILKMKVMESTATTLPELIGDITRIEQYIESKLGGVGDE